MTTVGTKIEVKTAKNGVQMFFAIDEFGKKRRITRKDAIVPYAYQVREELKADREAQTKVNTEETAAAVEVNGNEKFTTVKADDAAHAVEILDKLNFRNVEFVYHGDTNEHGLPVVYRHFDGIKDGHDTCFGLIEIVIDGKLDAVRFINNYREQFTDIKIGNAKYTLGDKGEINLIDEPETKTDDETKMTTIETKMTVSELKEALKASRNKVRLHFTAKGNPSWQSVYRYGKKDHEIGYCRISKREANERLAEFGLTANLVIEIDKAKAEVAQCRHLCIDQMGAVLAKFAKAENETVNSNETDEVKDDDSKLAELFEDREDKRRAALHSSFDSEESKAARDANKAVEEFIGKVAKDLRDKAPVGLSVVASWDSADLDAPKFVVIELATDKRTSYSKTAEVKAALKVTKTVTVKAENVGNLTGSALAASNSRLAAFNTPEEKVDKLFDAYEAQNSVAHISENGYIAAVNFQPQNTVRWHCKIRRYQNLDEAIDAVRYVNEHDTFTVTRGGRVEIEYGKYNERTREYFARTLYGVEYFKEAYFDELADQYAVTVDAFIYATNCEIELANKAAETVAEADGYDESAFDLLPTVDELNDCRSDIEKEFDEFAAEYTDRDARFNHGERHAAKLEKQLRELDPTVEVTYDIDEDGEDVFYLRFGKYVYRSPFATLDAVEETFHLWREADRADNRDKSKRTNVMNSIFNHEHMTFNTPAEALAFIEKVANDTFEYVVENPHYLIRDENDEWTYATARTFSNVNSMSPDYGTYEFTEIITADGKLDHVIFQRGFGIGAKTVKLYIEAPTDDLDEALHRVWKRLGHKHRWHIGRDSWDDPYPYYLDEDGEEVEADICDDDECREVEEQLGLIYADKRDYPGLSGSGWYAEDDPRLKDGYNESYSWREVEAAYYRDVL